MSNDTLLIGAVAYTQAVVPIWEGMRTYLRDEAGLEVDIVLFLNYGTQVDALLAGRIDIGWNTNLAYLQAEARSAGGISCLAMRDTDIGWHSHIIAPAGGAVRDLETLRGQTLALGSRDSGHAAILPVHFLAQQGLVEGTDYESLRFDLDVGKHGDTGTSELDVFQAVLDGRAQAGAVGSPFWTKMQEEGLIPGDAVEAVWTSEPYHHCMFNGRPGLDQDRAAAVVDALLAMDWDNPVHQPILRDEGLKAWIRADTSGYDSLREAGTAIGLIGA